MSINDYIFESNEPDLGQCRFGVVKRARNKSTNKFVSVKIIHKNQLENTTQLSLQEIENWKKFNHPNIIKYLNHFETKDDLYIITEYVDGENLSKLIDQQKKSNKPLSEDFVCQVLSQMLSALSYLHNLKVIHGEIKLEHILHSPNGQIKLIGINIFNVPLSKNSKSAYKSPEYNKGQYSYQTDIWSLGVVLYVLMTFELPFQDLISSLLGSDILPIPTPTIQQNYSNELKEIVYSMLNKNPSTRVQLKDLVSQPFVKQIRSNLLQESLKSNIDKILNNDEQLLRLENDYLRDIEKGDVNAMYNYANDLCKGIFGGNRRLESEKYYLMAIELEHADSMYQYANHLSRGLYGEDKKGRFRILLFRGY